jgi:hypothetical protein
MLTVHPNFALGAGDVLTLSGLAFLTGGGSALAIGGADAARVGSSGSLNGAAKTLTLTVAGGQSIPSGADSVFAFTLTNPSPAPDAGLLATLGLSVTSLSDIGSAVQSPFTGTNVFRGISRLPA